MLILKNEDVEYCNLSHQKSSEVENIPGIKYHGHLFVKVKSYAKNQLHNAILRCRELLEHNTPVQLPIILKESTGYSIWFEHQSVKEIQASNSGIAPRKTTANSKHKTTLKYRGVEIVKENKQSSQSSNRSTRKMKYRGKDYFK